MFQKRTYPLSLAVCQHITYKFLFIRNYILVLYFEDYDIQEFLRMVKNGFTVKVKNIYIQVQNAVDVKRMVTRLALFQLSEGQSRSSKRES